LVGTNLLNDELIVLDVSFPETINLVKTSATTLFGLVVLGIGLWLLLKNA